MKPIRTITIAALCALAAHTAQAQTIPDYSTGGTGAGAVTGVGTGSGTTTTGTGTATGGAVTTGTGTTTSPGVTTGTGAAVATGITGGTVSSSRRSRRFFRAAYQDNLGEVALGQFILTTTTNPAVQNVANTIVAEHSAALTLLQSSTAALSVTAPTSLSRAHRGLLRRLQRNTALVDIEYLLAVIGDHQEDIADYSDYAAIGDDLSLVAYATTYLPILQKHLNLAVDAFNSLRGVATSINTSAACTNSGVSVSGASTSSSAASTVGTTSGGASTVGTSTSTVQPR